MDEWYSLNLGDGITSGTLSAEIEKAFKQAFADAGKPKEMAVFTRFESEGRLQCEVFAFFSPAAKRLAETFDAEPCERPARSELGLLAGEPESWSLLFPEV